MPQLSLSLPPPLPPYLLLLLPPWLPLPLPLPFYLRCSGDSNGHLLMRGVQLLAMAHTTPGPMGLPAIQDIQAHSTQLRDTKPPKSR